MQMSPLRFALGGVVGRVGGSYVTLQTLLWREEILESMRVIRCVFYFYSLEVGANALECVINA